MLNMLALIEKYAEFSELGIKLAKTTNLNKVDNVQNIIYAGMGGSAIAGDIIKEILYDKSNISFHVIRDYVLPLYANKHSLIILSSFSGNTEETLSIANQTKEINAKTLCFSSGGMLFEQFSNNNFLKIELDIPPRAALPISLFSILYALNTIIFHSNEINHLLIDAQNYIKNNEINREYAKIIAQKIHNKIPIIYTNARNFSIARRFANQLSENAKQIAHFNELPEMNHNEIVGLELPPFIKEQCIIIFIEDEHIRINERVKKRFQLTREILKQEFDIIDINMEGNNEISAKIDTIRFVDYVSYYTAVLNKVDPIEIKRIDILKNRMNS